MTIKDSETTITLNQDESRFTSTSIEIFYRGAAHKVTEDNMPFSIGRDHDKCALIIDNPMVSREHFCLTSQDGLVGLADKSTNGTWVQLGRAEEVLVKNQFLPLVGTGVIQAGCKINDNVGDQIHFKVVRS